MIVFTAQHRNVVAVLASGDIYYPDWSRARPFNPELDSQSAGPYSPLPEILERTRPQRQRAYRFMAEMYALKKGREKPNALVYGFVNRGSVETILSGDDVLLVLDVPDSEVLPSQHTPWSNEILAGARVTPRGNSHVMPIGFAEPSLEKSWQTIFDTSSYGETVQLVIDRIEPEWVLEPDLREYK